jgi:hypothetical protein
MPTWRSCLTYVEKRESEAIWPCAPMSSAHKQRLSLVQFITSEVRFTLVAVIGQHKCDVPRAMVPSSYVEQLSNVGYAGKMALENAGLPPPVEVGRHRFHHHKPMSISFRVCHLSVWPSDLGARRAAQPHLILRVLSQTWHPPDRGCESGGSSSGRRIYKGGQNLG